MIFMVVVEYNHDGSYTDISFESMRLCFFFGFVIYSLFAFASCAVFFWSVFLVENSGDGW